METPDYLVEISGINAKSPTTGPNYSTIRGRPWIAVEWACCEAYSRIYRNPQATAYEGRCPRCQRQVRVRVGPGGTNHRFFRAE